MQRELVLEKTSVNKLNGPKTKKQLQEIRKAAEANQTLAVTAKLRGRLKPSVAGDSFATNYKYSVVLILSKEGQRAEEALDLAEKVVRKVATLQKWQVLGEAKVVAALEAQAKSRPPFIVWPMTDDVIATQFADIVGCDANLRLIHDATEAFIQSNGVLRNHTILYGEPGAAKTSMFMKLKEWYESDNCGVERVKALDATSISKAGLENWILDQADAGELPEILYLEEVEKFDMNVLLPLGSLMDGRGVLTKLNARVNRTARASILVWMTCNDEDFVKKWHRGYLWSRCTQKIECCRPTREEMESYIIPSKIKQMGGDPSWTKYVCDFAYDQLKTDDPREIIGLLAGRHRLVDGTYQRDKLQVLNRAELKKKKNVKKDLDIDLLS
jgi:hypothetical protein